MAVLGENIRGRGHFSTDNRDRRAIFILGSDLKKSESDIQICRTNRATNLRPLSQKFIS